MSDGAGATREAASTPSAPWSDGKRYLWLVALVMPTLPFVAMGMFAWTGWGVWLWLGPIVILGVVPVLDLVAGLDRSNPPDDVIAALEKDRYYRWLTFLFLPIQYAGFVTAFWFIATGDISVLDKVGLAVTVGFIAGLGINTAHELGHKRESHERWLAKIALAQSFYGHFYIEHNRGHHVRVATPADPASSRVGESFYAFWPRTVVGSLASAWRLERRRYGLRHQHPFRLGNDVINAWLMTVVLWTVMVVWLGVGILPVPRDPGADRPHAARGGELPRALRHAAADRRGARQGALRAGRPQPQLELQQPRHERAALPPAAAQRPPCEPDPAVPGAARLQGVARPADRLRGDDPARARAGGLAPDHGPPCPRAHGRRHPPCEHRPPASRARAGAVRRRLPTAVATARPPRRVSRRCDAGRHRHGLDRPRLRPLPGLRLRLRRGASATRARASPPAPPGRRCPRTGAARTAASATRPTSSASSARRHDARDARLRAAHATRRSAPAHRRGGHRDHLARRLVGGDHGRPRRAGRGQPADGLQRGGLEAGARRGGRRSRARGLPLRSSRWPSTCIRTTRWPPSGRRRAACSSEPAGTASCARSCRRPMAATPSCCPC